jgi:hypothetical protein
MHFLKTLGYNTFDHCVTEQAKLHVPQASIKEKEVWEEG